MKARLVIPVWGDRYAARLQAACLPALLAPGNLPHLAAHFECELVVVTESRLEAALRALPGIAAAREHAGLRFVFIDDVLSHPAYYGMTLTHALYRGFTDLGEGARDVWCLFLNADFVLADGSYRTLVPHMQAEARCILAPSYCAIEEDVRPGLEAKARAAGGVLALAPRDMAGLILDHRHYTIRAKTINWKMYRTDRADQFYYHHDNDTLLCRQLPIAVVALRPERVPPGPVTFWDYGVVSEVCPSRRLTVLGDSDEFLMLELRGRRAMREQLSLGWMDPDDIARDLSIWTTRDQRDCGEFTLTLHRRDVPADIGVARDALEHYYRDVMSRVAGEPRDHRRHYIWTGVTELHAEWKRNRSVSGAAPPATPSASLLHLVRDLLAAGARAPFHGRPWDVYHRFFDLLRATQFRLFGRAPDLGALHPQRNDRRPVVSRLREAAATSSRALAVWTSPAAAVAPHLGRWAPSVVEATPEDILAERELESLRSQGPFDLCLLELTRDELLGYAELHSRLRTIMRKGARVIAFHETHGLERLIERDFHLMARALPACDAATLEIRGGRLAFAAQRWWSRGRRRAETGRVRDLLLYALVGAAVAPCVAAARIGSSRRGVGAFVETCTSLCLVVTIL